MALIITSIKLINPSYFTIVYPHPNWLCYYCNVSCICYLMSLTRLRFIAFTVLYCVNSIVFYVLLY